MSTTLAAPLPPRKNVSTNATSNESTVSGNVSGLSDGSRCHGSTLETLLQMGFTQARAEKALAATGSRGVQIAADWLVAHIHDPHLDEPNPRTYVLYLCPSSGTPLAKQLQTFWDASSTQIGFNAAHNSFPHMTLFPAMSVSDAQVETLLRSVKAVADNFAREFANHGQLKLEKYISPNFVALFVGKNEEILLRSFVQELSDSLSSSLGLNLANDTGVSSSSSKSYHVTLAYQFSAKHFAGLQDLAEAIDVDAGAEWELRLYSFDSRLAPKDVSAFKVVYAHVPNEADELDLRVGDFVYVNEEEMLSDGVHGDGWVFGTSWLTGCSGFLPKNYVVRSPEPNAWTLHLSLPLGDLSTVSAKVSAFHASHSRDVASPLLLSNSTSSLDRLRELSTFPSKALSNDGTNKQDQPVNQSSPQNGSPTLTNVVVTSCPDQDNMTEVSSIRSGMASSRINRLRRRSPAPPRKLFIVRHGERVDFTFGAWIPYSFGGSKKDLTEKKYIRKDLNMPHQVPQRRLGPEGFFKDCPLTLIGTVQARLVGEAMKESGVTISHVYCSPSLRCVQTCHHILLGMGLAEQLKIHIEPGLFEWLAWYQDGMPDFMTPTELMTAGYNVETNYKPYISVDELEDLHEQLPPETHESYYTRNFFVTQCVLQKTEDIGGNLLFIGHSATLDACSRQLLDKEQRTFDEMMNTLRKVAYCGVAMLQEEEVEPGGHDDTASITTTTTTATSNFALEPRRKWKVAEPPFPPITHCSSARFDWKILNE